MAGAFVLGVVGFIIGIIVAAVMGFNSMTEVEVDAQRGYEAVVLLDER